MLRKFISYVLSKDVRQLQSFKKLLKENSGKGLRIKLVNTENSGGEPLVLLGPSSDKTNNIKDYIKSFIGKGGIYKVSVSSSGKQLHSKHELNKLETKLNKIYKNLEKTLKSIIKRETIAKKTVENIYKELEKT